MIEQKNVILAVAISIVILLGWQYFYETPRLEEQQARIALEQQAEAERNAKLGVVLPGSPTSASLGATAPATGAPAAGMPAVGASGSSGPRLGVDMSVGNQKIIDGLTKPSSSESREAALKATPRIPLRSERLSGSISLVGGRIDDLVLTGYHEELDKSSPEIVLLRPTKSEKPYYAEFGWIGEGVKTPTAETLWTARGTRLTPKTPLLLTWENGDGVTFERRYGLDDNYMVTLTQRVKNSSGRDLSLAPYGLLSRTGTPDLLGFYILHEGMLGVFDETLTELDYSDLRDDGTQRQSTTGGWLGITDKYWLAALIPDQKVKVETSFSSGRRGNYDLYQADYLAPAQTVKSGGVIETTNSVFAGAKVLRILEMYETEHGVTRFDLAVDFGWFYFLTKPIFHVIIWLNDRLGNFGLAILALTVMIKLAFFPLANKSYVSMSRMKKLQPKLVELREHHGDDRQGMNQAMMALYKTEKVNPAAGCLPMLVQIPVFFALYKTLFVSIEMRHAPYYGWIHDLSAPDPLGILTGFGMFPWEVPATYAFLNLGIWPLIMGFSMFLQQRLNPAPADPMQAKIFMFMPIMFTFLLAKFPAGLVIYWAWNNVLSMTQQWIIMRRMGVAVSGGSTKPAPTPTAPPRGKSGKGGSSKGGSGKKRSGKNDSGKSDSGKSDSSKSDSSKSDSAKNDSGENDNGESDSQEKKS
ncbi:MAG: membrane protein insertase YidC [Alphaproteobacteria bacterium]|nr:membrane protein insertase YidC [Alphaproteobacteria bacterium]